MAAGRRQSGFLQACLSGVSLHLCPACHQHRADLGAGSRVAAGSCPHTGPEKALSVAFLPLCLTQRYASFPDPTRAGLLGQGSHRCRWLIRDPGSLGEPLASSETDGHQPSRPRAFISAPSSRRAVSSHARSSWWSHGRTSHSGAPTHVTYKCSCCFCVIIIQTGLIRNCAKLTADVTFTESGQKVGAVGGEGVTQGWLESLRDFGEVGADRGA